MAVQDGEENTRKTPVNEVTQRSDASPRRIGGNMNKRSDRLVNMHIANSTAASAVNVAGAQKHILLGRRQRADSGKESVTTGKGGDDRPKRQAEQRRSGLRPEERQDGA